MKAWGAIILCFWGWPASALRAQEASPITVPQIVRLIVEDVPDARILTIILQASCVERGDDEAVVGSLHAVDAPAEILRVVALLACPPAVPAVPETTTPAATSSAAPTTSVLDPREATEPGCGTPGLGLGLGLCEDQFTLIPAGSFSMGNPDGERDERRLRTVNITRPFLMQRTEVTQAQWRDVMGTAPSHFSACGDTCPVENVSWKDIQEFLEALNRRIPGRNFRLPTEAEWEYAARAGATDDGNSSVPLGERGWHSNNSGNRSHPVAQKQPNGWGLHDMYGNVGEWVQDWYDGNYPGASPVNDPTGPSSGSERVVRGGSWIVPPLFTRASSRDNAAPSERSNFRGFRLVASP